MDATSFLFCTVVAVVGVVVGLGMRRAGFGFGVVAILLLAYIALPGGLARAGALDRDAPLPAPALILVLGLSALTCGIVFSAYGRRSALAIPVAAIVSLQAFRIGVEWLLHRLYIEGAIPVEMTYSGRNWDIVSGVTGLVLGIWLWRGRDVPRSMLWTWNLLGLGLLLNIISIAVLATPVPFRRIVDGPPNLLPSTFPYVWLPSFLVQVALGSHLLLFRKLRQSVDRR